MLNKTYVGKTSDIQLQLIDALESVYGQDDQTNTEMNKCVSKSTTKHTMNTQNF